MQWIHHYQLFLFDLDGLLVNTEELHYQAYQDVLHPFGFDWDFSQFCMHAHYSSLQFKNAVCSRYPHLSQDWETRYAEKQQRLIHLLKNGEAHLMPGAHALLERLHQERIPSCVVTNSPETFVSILREKNPALNTIPHWITRRDYTHPKPHPECYQKAIQLYAKDNDQVIGFEDTPKGMHALLKTQAIPVLISRIPYPEITEFQNAGVLLFPTLEHIEDNPLLLKKEHEEAPRPPLDACL